MIKDIELKDSLGGHIITSIVTASWWHSLDNLCNLFRVSIFVQGSATLSMAYAGALFADACLRGLANEPNVEEFAYVDSDKTELPYFATKVTLGPNGKSSNSPFSLSHRSIHQVCVHT